ncbi:unnamed protein product [Sphagnum jensenii]|uniref:Uncharacterized protein n=1 Tax=Sphagnum jensenii TaxID=128206 RepID=A0ABP1B0A9_9BRYO
MVAGQKISSASSKSSCLLAEEDEAAWKGGPPPAFIMLSRPHGTRNMCCRPPESTKEVTYTAAGRGVVGTLKAPFTCRTEISFFSFEFFAAPQDAKVGGLPFVYFP